jgi:tRNA(Ile)-lysidine synthetase-like protein
MIENIIACLQRYNIDLTNRRVVVGVSTGVDSMTLLYSLQQLNPNFEIIVAHVNHGKREQSATEEQFIKNYCEENNIKCFVLKLSIADFSSSNFQEEARILRNEFFKKIMDKVGSDILMLAHHLNDDIETMLMRMIRGSNLKGYAGIEEYTKENGKIILRPFLKVLKHDIFNYAKDKKIVYYDDYTNLEGVYTRNRIRNNLVKELFKENENVHQKFLEFKNTILEASSIINEIRNNYISSLIKPIEKGISFKKDEFVNLTSFFQTEVIFEVLKEYRLGKQNVLEIIKLIHSEKQNMKIVYKKMTFVKEYNDIMIYFYELNKQDVYLVIDEIGEYPINDKYLIKVAKKSNNIITNLNKIWYNSNMLPIVIRTRNDGDKISLEYGTKKVKKLLIDGKVGILRRDETLVLEKDKEILAVLGYGKSIKLKTLKDCDIIIELKERNNDN